MPTDDLHAVLEERRDAIERLPSVIGTAVGASTVHVYVRPGTPGDPVRAQAERVLGGVPVEVIEMEPPEAQPD